MNAAIVTAPNLAPAPRPAAAIARDLWSASNALVELARRVSAGERAATDLDALATGLQRCASELRMGGGDGRA